MGFGELRGPRSGSLPGFQRCHSRNSSGSRLHLNATSQRRRHPSGSWSRLLFGKRLVWRLETLALVQLFCLALLPVPTALRGLRRSRLPRPLRSLLRKPENRQGPWTLRGLQARDSLRGFGEPAQETLPVHVQARAVRWPANGNRKLRERGLSELCHIRRAGCGAFHGRGSDRRGQLFQRISLYRDEDICLRRMRVTSAPPKRNGAIPHKVPSFFRKSAVSRICLVVMSLPF